MADKRDHFSYRSAAVGAIIAIGATLMILLALGRTPFATDGLCRAGEAPLVCTREWVNFIAIVVGGATIVFLARGELRDERWRKETAVVDGLPLRRSLVRAEHTASRIGTEAEAIARKLTKFREERDSLHMQSMLVNLRLIRTLWFSETLTELARLDSELMELHLDLFHDIQQLQSVYDPADLNDADPDPPVTHLTREQAVRLSELAYPRRIAANGVDLRDRVRALMDAARSNRLHEVM